MSETCGSTSCCGCNNSVWSGICAVDIPACAPCVGGSDQNGGAVCVNGVWTINHSYSGGLVVNGTFLIQGTYTLPVGELLLFYGLNSTLNVTGHVKLYEDMTMYLPDDDYQWLKDNDYTSASIYDWWAYFMYTGDPITSTEDPYLHVYSRQHCKMLSVGYTANLDTDGSYNIDMSTYDACTIQWVVPIATLVPLVVIGLGSWLLVMILIKCC